MGRMKYQTNYFLKVLFYEVFQLLGKWKKKGIIVLIIGSKLRLTWELEIGEYFSIIIEKGKQWMKGESRRWSKRREKVYEKVYVCIHLSQLPFSLSLQIIEREKKKRKEKYPRKDEDRLRNSLYCQIPNKTIIPSSLSSCELRGICSDQ